MKKIFHGLDVTRSILAISVALGHFFYWNGVVTHFPRSFFVAVDFFFVLSGFVISQSVFYMKSSSFDVFIKEFSVRRIFRIFPLYVVAFVVTVVIVASQNKVDPFFYFIISFFLLQSMGFDAGAVNIFSDTPVGIGWSLSVEFWVGILFFPIVYFLRKKIATLVYVCSIIAIFCSSIIYNFSPSIDVNFQKAFGLITFGALRGFVGFSCGAISYVAFISFCNYKKNVRFISFLEIFLFSIIVVSIYFPHNIKNEFVAPFLFAMLLTFVAMEVGYIGRFLLLNMFSSLRCTSYSIYLIHPIIIFFWRRLGISFDSWHALLYMAIVYFFSVFSYKIIEKPSLRFKVIFLKTS